MRINPLKTTIHEADRGKMDPSAVDEILQHLSWADGYDIWEVNWNTTAHIEFTLTIKDLRHLWLLRESMKSKVRKARKKNAKTT